MTKESKIIVTNNADTEPGKEKDNIERTCNKDGAEAPKNQLNKKDEPCSVEKLRKNCIKDDLSTTKKIYEKSIEIGANAGGKYEKIQKSEGIERRKQILAKNIREHAAALGEHYIDICRELDFSYPTFNDWIRARSYPRIEKIEKLAKFFGCEVHDLVDDHSHADPVEIPILGSLNHADIIGYLYMTHEQIPRGSDVFAVRIIGDSMAPRICNGDIVVVAEGVQIKAEDIVIVSVAGDVGCKLLGTDENGNPQLIPLNPDYNPMPISEELLETAAIKIIGKAIEVRGNLGEC